MADLFAACKGASIKKPRVQTLNQDAWVEHWCFAAGSIYKAFETTDFGWIIFQPGTLLVNGALPIRRLFKV